MFQDGRLARSLSLVFFPPESAWATTTRKSDVFDAFPNSTAISKTQINRSRRAAMLGSGKREILALPNRRIVRWALPASSVRGGPPPFSIMTLNVLNDIDRADMEAWRFHMHRSHIESVRPSVLALQEVQAPARLWGPLLTHLGYQYLSGRKVGGQGDCVLVAWQSARWRQVAGETVLVSEGDSQVAVMAVLDDVTGEAHPGHSAECRRLLVVAWHAKAGRTDEAEATRLKQVDLLSKRIDAWTSQFGVANGGATVWLGDFNAGPHSYGGRFPCLVMPHLLGTCGPHAAMGSSPQRWESAMVTAHLKLKEMVHTPPFLTSPESSLLAAADAPLPLGRDVAYAVKGVDHLNHPLFTTCKVRAGVGFIAQTIDHILIRSGECNDDDVPRVAPALVVTGYMPCPSDDPESDLAPDYLPKEAVWGSDHLSVCVEVAWATRRAAAMGSPSL